MSRVFVIAEAGVNHNGDLERAKAMVAVAATAGADAVKFQTFRADEITTASSPKASYQVRSTPAEETQRRMLRELELSRDAHQELAGHCREHRIEFLSTPFGTSGLKFLVDELHVARLKLPSGEITNGPLLLEAGRSGLPLIVSTGMSTLDEVSEALAVIAFGSLPAGAPEGRDVFRAAFKSPEGQRNLRDRVTLLHCTTDYPTCFEDANLRSMTTLAAAFQLPVGLSDHTEGVVASVGAVALGARVIEKHFTLDRGLPGPDQSASLEPDELEKLVREIRRLERALGSADKAPQPCELSNMRVVRRSLVANAPIAIGDRFTPENLTAKRPGTGLSPMLYWDILDRTAGRAYLPDELIDEPF